MESIKETKENIKTNSDCLVEMEKSNFEKKIYISPSLVEIGKINQETKGKNNPGGDPGLFIES